MTFILYPIALLIGVSLGLLGAGGAIIAVPAFVYLGNISPPLASGYALFVVAVATSIASIRAWIHGLINWRAFWGFGITTMITIYTIRTFLLPYIPHQLQFFSHAFERDWFLMVAFGLVLLSVGIGMLRDKRSIVNDRMPHPLRLALLGIGVGIIAGFLGVGGGFLMTPALVLWARLDMHKAVGTSLALICANSAVGVAGDLTTGLTYDWTFIIIFAILTTIGVVAGMILSRHIHAHYLRILFGWLVTALGIVVLFEELS